MTFWLDAQLSPLAARKFSIGDATIMEVADYDAPWVAASCCSPETNNSPPTPLRHQHSFPGGGNSRSDRGRGLSGLRLIGLDTIAITQGA
jgi:hypothetical protein